MAQWHPDIKKIREAAARAPSIFGQRPWDVQLKHDDRDVVELYADPSDPDLGDMLPREVVISCGAALYNIRLAIRVEGHTPSVFEVPHLNREWLIKGLPAGRTLLASVETLASRPTPPTAGVAELYEALWLRHSDRWPYYRVLPVPLPLLVEMEHAAAAEHGWLRVLHRHEQRRILSAAAKASDQLGSRLSRLNVVRRDPDGVRDYGVGKDDFGPSPQDKKLPPTRRDFWLPEPPKTFEHPQLMSLSTDDDRPLDWLRAGEALQHALLTGTRYSMSALSGRSARYRVSLKYRMLDWHPLRLPPQAPDGYVMTASFLTQSLELDDMNGQARLWPWQWLYREVPQVVLRVGWAPAERVQPPMYQASSLAPQIVPLGTPGPLSAERLPLASAPAFKEPDS
jgi:hypothetical protein